MTKKTDRKFILFVIILSLVVVLVNTVMWEYIPWELTRMNVPSSWPVLLYTMYTQAWTHSSNIHIFSNMFGFFLAMGIIIICDRFIISKLGGRKRSDAFYLLSLTSLAILPFVDSFESILIWGAYGVPVGETAWACGFSGIVMAFLGYSMYSMCRIGKILDDRVKKVSGHRFFMHPLMMVLYLGLLPTLSFIIDVIELNIGSATAHLCGYIFGFGLYWVIDRSGIENVSPWMPEILRDYNDADWL